MDKNIEAALAKVQALYEEAGSRIDALAVGQKIPATALAETVGALHGIKGPQAYPLLKIYFDTRASADDTDIVIKRGALGGIEKIK